MRPCEENTSKVPHTILTCCILHNICILRGNEVKDDASSDNENDDDDNDDSDQVAFGQGQIVGQALLVFPAD